MKLSRAAFSLLLWGLARVALAEPSRRPGTDAFTRCKLALSQASHLSRPVPESSGAEVEARIRTKEDRALVPAILGLLTTEDGTLGPMLPGRVPRFLRDLGRQHHCDVRALRWDSLTGDQQIALVEWVGAETEFSFPLHDPEIAATRHFYEISRKIPGLIVRPAIDIVVPAGKQLNIFGESYGPGTHVVHLGPIATEVEWGSPKDVRQFETTELHFRTPDTMDLTPGELALSVRQLLAGRGYPRGKQHQHAVSASAPSGDVFGGGREGRLWAAAVAAKLVADTNLLSDLILVRDLRKPLQWRGFQTQVQFSPLRAHVLAEIFEFFLLFAADHALDEGKRDFDFFKTSSVGVRGPSKFGRGRWSLEFRQLFAAALEGAGAETMVWMIDTAKSKMQALAGKHHTRLESDVTVLTRWLQATAPTRAFIDSTLTSSFYRGWPNASASLSRHAALESTMGPVSKAHLAESATYLGRNHVQWLTYDWSQSHWLHLSANVEENRRRQKQVEAAQRQALRALEAVPHPGTAEDDAKVIAIVADFVDAAGLQALAIESLAQW